MKSIEVVIRMGDRSKSDSGAVKWSGDMDVRTALVSGEDIASMKSEAAKMIAALLKQMDAK